MQRPFTLAVVILASIAALSGCGGAKPSATSTPHGEGDPKAIAIADQVMQALGGADRWNALHGLVWTFGAEQGDRVRGNPRRHAWDKMTGWHRVEGIDKQGRPYVIIDNINDSTGMAWVDGQQIQGDSLMKLIHRAKSTWVNDSYWFLMPYKLRDPGVTLKYVGATERNGATYDELALSFGHVGETPGDHYWVYVNRANHRVEDWEMVLEGMTPPPGHYTWEGWEQHDGLWFPTAHRDTMFTSVAPSDTNHVNVFTRDIQVVDRFPPEEFQKP
jgi:hypothetical protein